MSVGSLNCHKHLVGDCKEAFSMFYLFFSLHAYKATFEVGWIFTFGHDDTVVATPIIKDLAFLYMLYLPVRDHFGNGHVRTVSQVNHYRLLVFL